MKGSDFIFDYVYLLYYICHKINIKRAGSYIDSPDSIKKEKEQQKILSIKKIINAINTLQQSH